MLEEILRYIRNFFPSEWLEGEFKIEDGTIDLPCLDGQYFYVEGSALNDGLYEYPAYSLNDETFKGCITLLSIPKVIVDISKEAEEYAEKYKPTPYRSESFNGYSYTKAGRSENNAHGWQEAFADRLKGWRKL